MALKPAKLPKYNSISKLTLLYIPAMYDILQLNDMLVPELKEVASKLGIKGYHKLTKQDIIYKILDQQALAEKASGGEDVPVVEEPAPGRKIVVRKRAKSKSSKDSDV